MRESLSPSPLDEEKGRLSPPAAASPNPSPLHEYPPQVSSQVSLHKARSGESGVLTKNLGFPLRFLLRELDDSIPPWEDPERSVDSSKREALFPASPPLSPLRGVENTIPSENSGKSPGRDGHVNAIRLKSLLEDTGSPIGHLGSSPEKPAENHAPAALSEAVGIRRGKVMRVDSGVVRRAALRRADVGLRVSQVVLCLVSFSVMAANKTSGWAGDYFDRYQEYRRIVPEYSFLDARGLGALEGRSLDAVSEVYASDKISPSIKPPPISDGTPNESVSDVYVRVTQLMSILETQYYEETIVIISPDSDNLSILQAGLTGLDLRRHWNLLFRPGKVRFVDPKSIPSSRVPASAVYKCMNPPTCT